MNLAKKFSGTDLGGGHFVHGGFHPILRLDVGEVKLLERAAFGVGRKFMGERGVDVARHSAMAFDEVGVITIHRAHERCDAATSDRLKRPAQTFGAAKQFESKRGEASIPIIGQKRLEIGGSIEESSRGHIFADNIADAEMD
jgi:hypothetical protein